MNDVRLFAGDPFTPLDLFGNDTIILNRNSKDIRDVTKLVSDFTQSFELPPSPKNNMFFSFYFDPDVSGSFNPQNKSEAYLEVNGVKISQGYIELLDVSTEYQRPTSYSIVYYAELADLAETFNEDTLDQLRYTDLEHTLNYANVKNSWGKSLFGGKVVYPLADYERNFVYSTDPTVNDSRNIIDPSYPVLLSELKPAVNYTALFDLIQAQYDLTFNIDADITGVFDDTYLLYHKEAGDYINQQALSENQFVARGSVTASSISYTTIPFSTETMDKGNNFDLANDQFTAFKDGVYTFQFQVTTTGSPPMQTDIGYTVEGVGYYVTSLYIPGLQVVNFSVYLQSGQRVKMQYKKNGPTTMELDQYFWTLISVPQGLFNTTVDLGLLAPQDYRVVDFVSDVAKQFNLVINSTDNKTFSLSPLSSWYGNGTQRRYTKYLNIESGEIKKTPIFKSIKFDYSEGTDIALTSFKDSAKRNYGRASYTPSLDFAEQELEVIPTMAPVLPIELLNQDKSGAVLSVTGIYLLRFLDKESQPVVDAPRVFTFKEVLATANYYLQDGIDASGSPTVSIENTVPFCSIFEDFDASGTTGTLGFGPEEPYAGQLATETLYDRYWGDYIERVFDPNVRILTARCVLPLGEYLNLELNDQLEIGGQYWTINTLQYNLNTGEAQFELLQYFPDFVRRRISSGDFDGDVDFEGPEQTSKTKDKELFNLTEFPDGSLNWKKGTGPKIYTTGGRKKEPNRPAEDNNLSRDYGVAT